MSDEKLAGQHKLGIFSLVMIAAAFVVSVRNLPMMAETGLQMVFFALIAVGAFLIPVALVAAELATGWPKEGGVYAWVKEAFGDRWGFVAVWLLWFQMVIGMTGILSFTTSEFFASIERDETRKQPKKTDPVSQRRGGTLWFRPKSAGGGLGA